MNEKFYTLSKEKQDTIINAGFKVFSDNSYKKSPVQQIADEANISKSLLFYYFKDKK
ncbi:MAG: TetR/AcrR family transcriptional regulator, partial [Erysipelotrichaceae bacterium]|nr:TetR/AcrR family transcriptional regulator [Erysipelotrichaceae bacterium]